MSSRARPLLSDCRGFLLPVLLLVLASGSVLMLAAHPLTIGDAERPRASLLQARRALLAHVSAYPESYGPQGAGPGHLPCPDTDRWSGGSASPGWNTSAHVRLTPAGKTISSDGPNPPCGTGAFAVGWLPRHISFPTRREAFHVEASQRLVYIVSTSVVNNPARPLAEPGDAVIAAIIDPARIVDHGHEVVPMRASTLPLAVEALARSPRSAMTLITERDLFETAARRVAAWLIVRQRERRAASLACRHGIIENYAGVLPVERLIKPVETTSVDRVLDEAAVLRWVADMPLNAGCPEASLPGLQQWTAFDSTESTGSTESMPATFETVRLERVPLARHWFVRDGWAGRLSITADAACRALLACDLVRELASTGRDRHPPPSHDLIVLRFVQPPARQPFPDRE